MTIEEEKAYDRLVNEYEILRKALSENNVKITERIINDLNIEKELAVNFAPKGENSLLFLACQNGYIDQVDCLINAGAKCNAHKTTKCTPLYAAIRAGHIAIVKKLLTRYPDSINCVTSENWSALHVACINGKNEIVDLLLTHSYPREQLRKLRFCEWEYEFAFDPNQLDSFNQTPLYIACLSGNDYIIERLLNWRVVCYRSAQPNHELLLCPIDLNLQCAGFKETALMALVRGEFAYLVSLLLRNGCNPNVYNSNLVDDLDTLEGTGNSVLIEAVRKSNRKSNVNLTALLLTFGAKDFDSGAIKIACTNPSPDELMECLLARQSHRDPEHKLNETQLLTGSNLGQKLPSYYCNTYCHIFPQHPTVINWNFVNCQLNEIKIKWILAAVRNCNPKLKISSTMNQISLGSVTRIDISHNNVTILPLEIFSMCSLKYLNAAKNKIEHLPTPKPGSYSSPVLEEIYLQDNSLEDILPEIFRLPSLNILDISNNKLQKIPFDMWRSPKLRELNIAFNLLKNLPTSEESNVSTMFKYKSTELKTMTRNVKNDLIHQNIWSKSLEIVDRDASQFQELRGSSALRTLNLSNNLFTSIPPALPCLAENLSRLNMSYNSLRSMSHVTSYPCFLRQLDLSHNEISCWPSLVTVNSADPYLACHNNENGNSGKFNASHTTILESSQTDVYLNLCCHKKHLRLESLRTLILADNLLTKIQLSTDDITTFSEIEENECTEWTNIGMTRLRLLYPNLSMLDISNNCLKEVPHFLHKLTNLSILNISGNADVTDLPANMGLLTRLWNLNTKGCSLQNNYLNSMIESKKFKTMEIIGFLKSVFENAKPYARMKLMVVGSQGIGKTSILEILREIYPNQNKKILGADHWTKRMGATVPVNSKKKNSNISTVGVDIGDLVCEEKRKNGTSMYGPVVFRTWDFGGQKEYYATHQYFLSKRSLYLVVWRIDDGKNGLVEVLQWLGNIQARAPNSPVIIVGTHYDNVGTTISEADVNSLQQYIRERFIAVTDAEKIGLPKVMSSIEISCKTLHNVRELGSLIYDAVFSLKSPGSKELLLHQNVPASYLALEDVVGNISAYLKTAGSDPVLNYENFKRMVYQEMHYQNFKSFRDAAELQQAVQFLHENGVLLHYNDTTLRDFYFLDPQWLCDMLAQVVTIKEINPFVKNGVMKIDDINHLIKTSTGQAGTDRKYILNLLNKFEVALTWDFRTLLIPSLLPLTEDEPENTITLKIPFKSPKRSISESNLLSKDEPISLEQPRLIFKQLSRLLLISYFPSGFWSRLMIRILADSQIGEIGQNLYNSENVPKNKIHWRLWQCGLELYFADQLIFKLREVPQNCRNTPYRHHLNKFKIKQDGIWADVDLSRSSILEIFFPLLDLDCEAESGQISVPLNIQHVTKLLSACVDHVDILLEDWYPTIGTRFVHTSEGRFLVTRVITCPFCISRTQDSLFIHGSLETINIGIDKNSNENDQIQLYGDMVNNHEISPLQTTFWNYLWTVEECVLSTYDKKVLVCPIHGDVSVVQIAPDLVFLDLNPKNVIDVSEISKGNLIGRGAFGFVFKATWKKASDEEGKLVAMKMLQPVQPGIRTRKSALLAYKAALEKWRREPLQHSCKAYFTARQELTVMLNLRHANIMSLIGICVQPLALILDCAPLGALDVIIQNYRRSGSRIGLYCFQLIVLQTSRAIEYLHRGHIIYRDLKAENVLVWKFPKPIQFDAPDNPVHIKIADYGISRFASPTGTKGFGGTEGFMAPEIISHNGEEEYTEKVDCFSFGMFLYELITLRQPFEGHETVKESILEGSRPVLTTREVMFPSYCLDLMVLCWDQQPKNRPSASQIVSIACAPEFTHMIDVILLPHSDNVLAMCTLNNQRSSRDASFKLWISIERCIEIITGQSQGWLNYQRYQPSQMIPVKCEGSSLRMTAMCSIKINTVWFGDSRGFIHSINESDNTCAFSYELDSVPIIAIECIAATNYVAAGSENGRLFILDSTCYPIKCVNAKDDFVLADVCINSKLSSLSTYCHSLRAFAVWCGHSYGKITIFEFKTDTFESRNFSLQHTNSSPEISVATLVTSQTSVYSYPSPGCVLYQWNTFSKKFLNQLDCLKLVPCSESLGSISIDKNLSVGRCQITAVCAFDQNIYVGTSWGCLIVAESTTLTPITVFRPYEEEVQYIGVTSSANAPNGLATILSVGKGYRSLIHRYTDTPSRDTKEKKNHQTHCILWRAEHWTPI